MDNQKCDLKLYTLDTCDRCKLVKQMLDKHNVKYQEIQDKELMTERNFLEAPTIEIGDKVIDTYSGVLGWLEDNNYYSL